MEFTFAFQLVSWSPIILSTLPFLADILPQRNKGFISFFHFLRICVYMHISSYLQNLLVCSRCGKFQNRDILLKGQVENAWINAAVAIVPSALFGQDRQNSAS